MAIDVRTQAALALHRFGFSPKAGALASIGDAHAILIAELENPAAGQITKQGLPGSGEAARAAFNFRQEQQAARLAVRGQSQSGDQEPNRAAADDPRSEMMQNGTRQGAPKPNPGRACRSKSTSKKPKIGLMPPSTVTSALSSGLCGSGPTIFVCRPTRAACGHFAAHLSERQFGRMCEENLPTCLLRLNRIRQCCSISIMRAR